MTRKINGSTVDQSVTYIIRAVIIGLLGWAALTLNDAGEIHAVQNVKLDSIQSTVETTANEVKTLDRRITTMEAHHDD